MVRTRFGRNTRSFCPPPAALIAAVVLSSSLCCAAQGKAMQTPPHIQVPAPGNTAPATSNQATPPSNRLPATGNPASAGNPGSNARPITGIIQPSLDTVHQTLTAVHLDKWKKGTVRDEASVNIRRIPMPLVSMRQLLDEAAKGGYGVGAFNVNDMEQIQAIMGAAKETKSPVIIQASRGARQFARTLPLPPHPGGGRTESRDSHRHAPGSRQQL
jgi:hypothetical protein